jgi:phosphoribosyl-ATP pyrophosphohydrolase
MSDQVKKEAVLERLYKTIEGRKGSDPQSSYTAQLFSDGRGQMAKKLGEEATETVVAALSQDKDALVRESGDLLYHLLVLWAEAGINPEDVWKELESREGVSGLDEKASRAKQQGNG